MKKLSLFALAAAAVLFGACSSDKDVAGGGGSPFEGRGEGFFKVNINLPTSAVVSTRAWGESGNLDDGLGNEYAVDDALLLLFEGDNEASAELVQTIDLLPSSTTWDTTTPYEDTSAQITSRKEFVAQLKNAPTKKLFALAVLNNNSIIAPSNVDTKVKINGTETTGNTKLSDLQGGKVTSTAVNANGFTCDKDGKKHFFMTNAVLSDVKGGTVEPKGAKPQTLAPVNAALIYETEAAATKGQPAVDIYVERAVAKVTLEKAEDYLQVNSLAAGNNLTGSISATLSGWTLDNTNKSSFIVRNVPTNQNWTLKSNDDTNTTGSDAYRFVGGNPVDPAVSLYRTYWAADPNYATAWTTETFSAASALDANPSDYTTNIEKDNPLYCLENTFDVEHQTYKNTTRAILAVKLTSDNADFYTIGADRKTLYGEKDVRNRVIDHIMNQPAFKTWFTEKGTGELSTTNEDNGKNMRVEWSSDDAGKITVTKVIIPKDNITGAETDLAITNDTKDPLNGDDLLKTLNNTQLVSVERFKGGISYYSIRIQHFGDDLTPWNEKEYGTGTEPAESNWDDIYPNVDTRDANYLGRYGMVRNNWYELKIGEILKIGDSTVPSLTAEDDPDHPDDKLEDLYIKARINILSWAKRTQSWPLK